MEDEKAQHQVRRRRKRLGESWERETHGKHPEFPGPQTGLRNLTHSVAVMLASLRWSEVGNPDFLENVSATMVSNLTVTSESYWNTGGIRSGITMACTNSFNTSKDAPLNWNIHDIPDVLAIPLTAFGTVLISWMSFTWWAYVIPFETINVL